jgi:hypothetical protein
MPTHILSLLQIHWHFLSYLIHPQKRFLFGGEIRGEGGGERAVKGRMGGILGARLTETGDIDVKAAAASRGSSQ